MALQAFNPNDFILQEIVSPDNKKTLVEYDAAHRMILVRVKEIINGKSEDKYRAVYFKQNINDNFLNALPDEFCNDKDKLILFAIYDDGSYDLVKQKMKYDFATKQAKWVKYESNELSLEQAKEIFDVLKSMLFLQQIIEKKEKHDAILEIVNKQEYLDLRYEEYCQQRDILLRESDYRVLEDYPESFEGEKNLWITWREILRNFVKKPSDFTDPLEYITHCENFAWPHDPLVYYSTYPNLDVEYLSTEDQFKKQYELISTEAQQRISNNILSASLEAKTRNEKGIPINKQILDIVEKYRLLEGVLELNINDLVVEG